VWIFTLADPMRVVIDLSGGIWIPAGYKLQGVGLVGAMRYGLFQTGTSRIVLDLAAPAEVAQVRFVEPAEDEPLRLLIDLLPIAEPAFRDRLKTAIFASSEKAPKPAVATDSAAAVAAEPPIAPRKPVIVIDPGHGGIDPGAIGDDATEKDITLIVAMALRDELLETGRFRVELTRTKDVFVPCGATSRSPESQGFYSFRCGCLRVQVLGVSHRCPKPPPTPGSRPGGRRERCRIIEA
jgi:N-acetylmuramoyl-L-alanine amidase